MSQTYEKNPANVARGLKAAIHNPNVSEEAKQRDYERLQEMGETMDTEELPDENEFEDSPGPRTRLKDNTRASKANDDGFTGPNANRVLGGYKATLSNPRTSEAAKIHAEQVLEANDI